MKNTDNNADKNTDKNITSDSPAAGMDLFADSEDFLNELTDSELVQINGGTGTGASSISLLLCDDLPLNL